MKNMIECSRMLVKLKSDRIEARKAGDKLKANLLGVIIGEANQLGIGVTDEQVLKIVKSTMKSVNERIEKEYSDCDLSSALAEAEILQAYLPKEISDQSLVEGLESLIYTFGDKNMGVVMKEMKAIVEQEGFLWNGKKASEIYKQIVGKLKG